MPSLYADPVSFNISESCGTTPGSCLGCQEKWQDVELIISLWSCVSLESTGTVTTLKLSVLHLSGTDLYFFLSNPEPFLTSLNPSSSLMPNLYPRHWWPWPHLFLYLLSFRSFSPTPLPPEHSTLVFCFVLLWPLWKIITLETRKSWLWCFEVASWALYIKSETMAEVSACYSHLPLIFPLKNGFSY